MGRLSERIFESAAATDAWKLEMKATRIIPLGLVAGLTGCATPYQAMNWDGGYQQRQIASDQYIVGFRGNSFTRYQEVRDLALLRAAEIGEKLGFKYMAVLSDDDRSSMMLVDTGSTSYTTGAVYGNTISATTQTYGGTTPAFKPGVNLSVKYFTDRPEPKYLQLYQISDVKSELEKKHGIHVN
jgi:hypothetical protein